MGGEKAFCASTERRAPPAAGGGPCRRAPAPWTRRGGGAAAPQRLLHAGAALCYMASSMLVLRAVLARRLWHCTACRGEWRAARAAPRVARTAPESALDGPARAARALREPTHRLPSCGDSLVDGVQISRLSIKIGAGWPIERALWRRPGHARPSLGGGSNPAVPGDEPGQCALERPHTLCRLRRYVG